MTTALPILRGPRIPETPGHSFKCVHLNGTLSGAECLRRQTKRLPVRGHYIDKTPRVPPHLEHCASGKCEQGNEIRAKFSDWKPEERSRPDPSWATYVQPPKPEPRPSAIAAQAAVIEKLPRAPEVPLPELDDEEEEDVEEKNCATPGCKQRVRANSKSGQCRWCARGYGLMSPKHGVLSPSDKPKNRAPANDAPPRRKILGRRARAAQRAADGAPALPADHGRVSPSMQDLEEMLRERHQYHLAEAERCDRALKALRA